MLKYSVISGLLYLHLLIFQIAIAWRLFQINLNVVDQQGNSACLLNATTLLWSIQANEDYTVQRFIAYGFIFINFVISAQNISISAKLKLDLDIIVFIFILFTVTQIILGSIISVYIFGLLVYLCFDFRDFDKDLVYYAHIYTLNLNPILHRKQVIVVTQRFCILCMILNLLKIALLSYFMDISLIAIVSYFLFVAFSSSILFVKMFIFLRNELKLLQIQPEIQQLDSNKECFTSWFILFKSIIRNENFKYWRLYFAALYLGQVVLGQIYLPITSFLTIFKDTTISLKSYIFFDCLFVAFSIIVVILIQIAKYFQRVRDQPLIYEIHKIQQRQDIYEILPIPIPTQSNQKNIPNSQIHQLGECCFCLEQMNPRSNLKQLHCHPKHIFHHYCITQWLVNNKTCPLCKKEVF